MDNQETIIPQRIRTMLAPLSTEISNRNTYVQERDDLIYGDDLFSRVTWANGSDRTRYNWLERLVEIHVSQLMGRDFQVYSSYEKRDLSVAEDIQDPKQLDQDRLLNKKAKMDADARGKIIRGMIEDNGGSELFQTGAASGSAFGFTVYKSWLGNPEKVKTGDDIPWHIEMLENIQNYYALWSSDNFRKRIGDCYMYQIDPDTANMQYGSYLEEGQSFKLSNLGTVLDQPNPSAPTQEEGNQPMVTVMEYTGIIHGFKGEKGGEDSDDALVECEPGDETKVNVLVVGDCTVRIVADEDKVPRYYFIPNKRVQRRPYGMADVTPTCIDNNITYMERMSDWVTIANKTLFQKYKAKGFDMSSIPPATSRKIQMIPMDMDQDIEEIAQATSFGAEYSQLLQEIKENFVRSGGISQVLFDNPQLDANSNQALMTTMKGMIDTVEKKQKIWSKALVEMFEDAMRTGAKHFESLKAFVPPDENWKFTIRWPSIMRVDDPQKQVMDINMWNTGTISTETFMENRGVEDPSQEVDRIRDDMQDSVRAAIRGQQLQLLAQKTIAPAPGPNDPPPVPQVEHKFNWSLTATPEQAANIAETVPGMQTGPFGESMGPQGRLADYAEENAMTQGEIDGGSSHAGTPVITDKNGKDITSESKNPQQTLPDQNQPGQGVASVPGSGQPTNVSPEGAAAQANQQQGA